MRFSPTQISTFRGCKRKWAWRVVAGIVAPPSPAAELGTAVHNELEKYLRGGQIDFRTEVGYIAASGIEHLPRPGTPGLRIEGDFYFQGPWEHQYSGRIDFTVPGTIGDHKTTKNFVWQKTEQDLLTDEQSIIYSAWYFINHPAEMEVENRWIYYSTGKTRKSAVTKLRINQQHVYLELQKIEATCREMASIHTAAADVQDKEAFVLKLAPNVDHCSAYGGCFFQGKCNLSPLEKLHSLAQQDKAVIHMEEAKPGNTLLALVHQQNGAGGPATHAAAAPAAYGGGGYAPPQQQYAAPQAPQAPPQYAAPQAPQAPQYAAPQAPQYAAPPAQQYSTAPGAAPVLAPNALLAKLGENRGMTVPGAVPGMAPPAASAGPAVNPPEWQPPPPPPPAPGSPEALAATAAAAPRGRQRSAKTIKKKILKLASGTPYQAQTFGFLGQAGEDIPALLEIEANLLATLPQAAPTAAPAAAPVAPAAPQAFAPPPAAPPQQYAQPPQQMAPPPQYAPPPAAPQYAAPPPPPPQPQQYVQPPVNPTAGPAKNIGVLYIDCGPVNAPRFDANVLILEAKSRLAAGAVADWRYVEYGRGPGLLAEATAAAIDHCAIAMGGIEHVCLDTKTPEGQVVAFEFQVRARLVVR
jgi:hypothetical protein